LAKIHICVSTLLDVKPKNTDQKTGLWITENDNSWSCCRYQL